MANYRVHTDDQSGLRLRSDPSDKKANVIATMPEGQVVTKLSEATNVWWHVRTKLNGVDLDGFAAGRFLVPAENFSAPTAAATIQPVHMRENWPVVTRATEQYRAFPLGEPGMPRRTSPSPAQLRSIIDFLDVEKSDRYSPTTSQTYCNIYAYDYCYLANVYLPRVWWTSAAIAQLTQGVVVTPVYGTTIMERNANSLLDWLIQFGAQFGWRRTFSLEDLQQSANQGQVGVIVAQRVDLNRSGHIVVIAPEDAANPAKRNGGQVVLPLQSQAGAKNKKLGTGTAWWQGAQFRSFGYFIHG